ncbi:MAG: CRISPR-associated endonuclease Cas3'' [Gemmatimonadetes bacterium]|nr:CRISPR-associated endonuclease Cas3'' [Gemmatimonadota bacterium]
MGHDLTDSVHLAFWGKARPSEPPPAPRWHPVAYHLLDVAAVMQQLLRVRPLTLRRVAHLLSLSEEKALCLLTTLAALHDLGKFAPAFQSKAPELWPAALGPLDLGRILPGVHTEDGYVLWIHELADSVGERVWPGGGQVLEALASAIFGHHGRPVGARNPVFRQRFSHPARTAARQCADAVVELLCPEPITVPPPDTERARIASWYVAGLMTTADWVGSGPHWFRYTAPLADDASLARYWARAQAAAQRAVGEAGLAAPPVAGLRPFSDLTHIANDPTPLQRWAETARLPRGPCLVVIEDVTGAGKTEAAQMIVHRLLVEGRAAGAYWAMPTQATANAMYGRQARMIGALYADGAEPKPSLVLAHGQQRLHPAFRATVLPGAAVAAAGTSDEPGARSDGPDDLAGTVACTAFLADDSRAALLADVGAGTVDQAILGVLPSRFNTVRLVGLAEKVLVVDEAHAYDAYMGVELEALLRFQAALGGDAVVLSATLPAVRRAQLVQAWLDGVRDGGWDAGQGVRDGPSLQPGAYPLVTTVSPEGVREWPLAAAPWSRRSVPVRFVHTPDWMQRTARARTSARGSS